MVKAQYTYEYMNIGLGRSRMFGCSIAGVLVGFRGDRASGLTGGVFARDVLLKLGAKEFTSASWPRIAELGHRSALPSHSPKP